MKIRPLLRPGNYVHLLFASFQRTVRARRGDGVRAGRCLRVGCYKTALRSVLGFHVADFLLFYGAKAQLLMRVRQRSERKSEKTVGEKQTGDISRVCLA